MLSATREYILFLYPFHIVHFTFTFSILHAPTSFFTVDACSYWNCIIIHNVPFFIGAFNLAMIVCG